MELKDVVALQVKFFREQKGYSQRELSDICNFPSSYIFKVEKGLRLPNLENIFKICDGLSIKPRDFIASVEEKLHTPLP
ncbi:helix-turn-helix transcriptional regulator [Persicobacter psychrovividus]|uniref:HTH cro/C1-type domain-containing protein n=1 Tax=Persicobacter psychrovividus TaxID=387638 RepID=A0ABN6LGY5_9BACT|nr:hypothetical protein PEPS_46690 [Persicobacter psychrovividus]